MTVTDARGIRHDLGPGNGMGHIDVPTLYIGAAMPSGCAVCVQRRAVGGKLTCGPVCARRLLNRPAALW